MENANCLKCAKAHRTDHKITCEYHTKGAKRSAVLLWQCGLAPQPIIGGTLQINSDGTTMRHYDVTSAYPKKL